MELFWHGTAAVSIRSGEERIIFDPFVPYPGSETETKLNEFDGFQEIFVTHGHFDHIRSLPDICRRNPEVLIHCTKTPYMSLRKCGVPKENLSPFRIGQTIHVPGFTVRTYHGKHAVLPKATPERIGYMLRSEYRGNILPILMENRRFPENDETVFYLIEAEERRIALMGSLNLREEVEYPVNPDLLILPYNGWEDNLRPALHVIERIQPEYILLDHYDDTFPPFTMPIDLAPILRRFPGRIEAMKKEEI